MPAWGEIFGEGSIAQQFLLWGVGQQIVGAILAPILEPLSEELWKAAVDASGGALSQALPAADLADQVVRTIREHGPAAAEAAKSGVSGDDFDSLVKGAGEPPGLEFVLEAFRRGYIPFGPAEVGTPSVATGVASSRVYNYWLPVIERMLEVPISVGDAVDAVLRGQIPKEDGQREAYAAGISADRFQILLNAAGRPPSPTELVEFVRRGFIPLNGTGPGALTFQQGIFEGDAKDKWQPIYQKLVEYVPPPRTVTTLERSGAIDAATASKLYQDNGLTPQMAAWYSKSLIPEKIPGSHQLGQQMVLELYETKTITEPQAAGYLAKMGLDADTVKILLGLVDVQRAHRALQSAVTRVGTLYTGRKITKAGAQGALGELGVSPAGAAHLLAIWDAELAATVKLLTEGEIVAAVFYGNLEMPEAMAELHALGYSERDAWVLISNRMHGPQGTKPANGPPGPGVIP